MSDYLSQLLPTTGHYCVAMLKPQGGFRHFFHATLATATVQLEALDKAGHTVYMAQATFDAAKLEAAEDHNAKLPKDLSKDEWRKQSKGQRVQDNALFLRNFFFDIDCGEGKDYPDQKTAAAALKQFVAESGLPFPAVVSSGNGLYAQWLIEENIPAEQWKSVARILKQTATAYEFKTDPMRTADSASVLRLPGTTNRKPGKEPKAVSLVKDMTAVPFLSFVRALHGAAKKKKVNLTAIQPPKPQTDLNAEFYDNIETNQIPSCAEKVADKCGQMRLMRTEKGNLSEPLWYALLGVLAFCENGTEKAHEWSQGHPDYSTGQTDRKLKQWSEAGVGPTTCAKLGGDNPSGCLGCPHTGKIKSPIVLGRPEPKAVEMPEEQVDPPPGFRRTAQGLCYEEEGRWSCFYDQDLYPVRLAYDESLGYETTTIRHHLPHEGWLECVIRSSLVNDPKGLMTALADGHIKVVGSKEKKVMCAYIESYQARLQRQRRMSLLLCQMGWKEARNGQPMFVLGKKILHADGKTEDASFAKNVPNSAHGYRTAGDRETWAEATKVFGEPGMEPYAFALLAGGFGAPLMKFTGFAGAMISLTGETGVGKTLLQRVIQSVWGYHEDLMMLRDDTRNALVSRLGVYGNLPMTIDEVTNIDGIELSDLVYRITQGRDKARLTKNAEERKNINTWNTLAVVSSNNSLVEKLSGAKHDASAEINRVFEYPVVGNKAYCGEASSRVYWTVTENYGHAGEAYAQWLVQNVQRIKPSLEKVRIKIDGEAKIRSEERFWSAVASAAIYGGLVARSLGLIRFEIAPVMQWAIDTIQNMRGDKDDLVGDSVGILGQFLDEHAANRLIVKGDRPGSAIIVDPPRGPLMVRYELDNHRIFISRNAFRAWVSKRFGSFTTIKNDLVAMKALRNTSIRKTLGAGTFYSGAQQICWDLDMKCHKLGAVGLQIVQDAEMLGKGAKEG